MVVTAPSMALTSSTGSSSSWSPTLPSSPSSSLAPAAMRGPSVSPASTSARSAQSARSEDGSDSGESVATAPPSFVVPYATQHWPTRVRPVPPPLHFAPSSVPPRRSPLLSQPTPQAHVQGTRYAPHRYRHHHYHNHSNHYHHHQTGSGGGKPYISLEQHQHDLTHAIINFLSPLLPTEEEYRTKEALRRHLERLARQIDPHAVLLAFGSMANGFALRNSDMDLCCLISPLVAHSIGSGSGSVDEDGEVPAPPTSDAPPLSAARASELVELFSQLIRDHTDFNVMPLPQARIPIIKINKPSADGGSAELSCDIGFENRLALANTRLLLSYALVDPPRLRTMVLLLKVWTKRRKLNSPYTGTLSSYGYTLMALHFLMHVKSPPVLPNLQQMDLSFSTGQSTPSAPPSATATHPTSTQSTTTPSPEAQPSQPVGSEPTPHMVQGHNVQFYDDIASVRSNWSTSNTSNVATLLMEFFSYFSKEFSYATDVISIRTISGSFPKQDNPELWSGELCIQDPFATNINVSRPVTNNGLYTIRGEFFRAAKILGNRALSPETILEQLCEERDESVVPERHPRRWNKNRGTNGHVQGARLNGQSPVGSGLSGGVTLGVPQQPNRRWTHAGTQAAQGGQGTTDVLESRSLNSSPSSVPTALPSTPDPKPE